MTKGRETIEFSNMYYERNMKHFIVDDEYTRAINHWIFFLINTYIFGETSLSFGQILLIQSCQYMCESEFVRTKNVSKTHLNFT